MISDIGWQRQVDSFREHTWRLHHMACLSVCMACHVSCIACHTDMRCLLSQHTATYCNTLRHIASHVIPTCDVSCIPCRMSQRHRERHAMSFASHVACLLHPMSCRLHRTSCLSANIMPATFSKLHQIPRCYFE